MLLLLALTSAWGANWRPVEAVVKSRHMKLFPEAALIVGNQKEVLLGNFTDSSPDRIYDLASLTKVVATASAIMILVDRGQLALHDSLTKFVPTFSGGAKDAVTLEDLLRHRAGLPAGASALVGENVSTYVARISPLPLSYAPRSKTVYSDLSAIYLGFVVEQVSGKTLAEFAEENIFRPLAMSNTSFKPIGNCASTMNSRSGLPHDPTAYRLHPDSIGNAGLFSTVADLAKFARMLLNGGELGGVRILSTDSVTKMSKGAVRGLGWDLTSEYAPAPRGDVFPAGISYGHTGYTGTTLWLDPKSKTFYVFLSNRVLMGDDATRKPFSTFRRELSTAIGKVVYGRKRK